MKIVSWNVNGIRAITKKGELKKFLQKEKPDIFCAQEIKIANDKIADEEFDFEGYQEFWHSAKRPGYSGTLMLVKEGIDVFNRVDFPQDDEGRVLILEFKDFFVVGIYFPNANNELSRLDFKLDFNNRLLAFLKKLEKKKPLLIGGDYNVAHEEIDLARPKENIGNAGFTFEERNWMTDFLKMGFVDSFRFLNPRKIQYSWWSYRMNARTRNVGWRIDYWCVSKSFQKNIKEAFVFDKQLGSDHAPVGLLMK